MSNGRLIREASLATDGVADPTSTPAPVSTPAITLADIDIPVGFAWDIATVDIFLELEYQSGGLFDVAAAVTAFLYAGTVPLGSSVLQQAGPFTAGGLAGFRSLWRTILNLPSPVTILPTDRPFTVAVTASADPGVAAGTSQNLSVFRDGSKLTFYGGSRQ